MADVSINYKGSKIAELAERGNKTLKTSGKYCEGDIEVNYTPNSRTYELTLSKAYGWVLLTALDADVLEHINDDNFFVSLITTSNYVYEWYAGSMYFVGNRKIGIVDANTVYGTGSRETKETLYGFHYIPYPANSTNTNSVAGAYGQFRLTSGKYYLTPGDGYIKAGTYRLTFTW